MKRWSRGRLLSTNGTKAMSPEQRERASSQEQTMLFTDFSSMDSGISRKAICVFMDGHPNYQENVNFVLEANEVAVETKMSPRELHNACAELIGALQAISMVGTEHDSFDTTGGYIERLGRAKEIANRALETVAKTGLIKP